MAEYSVEAYDTDEVRRKLHLNRLSHFEEPLLLFLKSYPDIKYIEITEHAIMVPCRGGALVFTGGKMNKSERAGRISPGRAHLFGKEKQ